MISHDYRCVFIHIPRTGGNSIEYALEGIELTDATGSPTTQWDHKLHKGHRGFKRDNRRRITHWTAAQVQRQYPEVFQRYFTFTFVRNPWDQVVSRYGHERERNVPGAASLTFDQFINHAQGFLVYIKPLRFILNSQGEKLVEFIGRYENLHRDWEQVCDRLARRPKELHRLNASVDRKPYASYYDERTKSIVAGIFKEEIEYFGYQFEG